MRTKKETDYTNKYSQYPNSEILQKLLLHPIPGLVVHWIFQGLLLMDWTERMFKIIIDIVLTLVLGLFFGLWLAPIIAWPVAFLLSHTINFLFNAQPWVLLKHYGYVHHTQQDYESYLEGITLRVKKSPNLICAAIFGSRVKGHWRATSDLDIALVRKPGLLNGIKSCSFAAHERTRALFTHFPLDIRVLDDEKSLGTFIPDDLYLIIH